MARITLASQGLVIEALRLELAQANATIEALKGKAPQLPRTAPVSDFKARLAAARELAARGGRSVLL
jgi:hypothetical protein